MSSNNHGNRARSRAIRAEMSATGDSYTRTARTSTPTRPGHNLRAVCFECREDVPARGGVIHVLQREVSQFERDLIAARERRVARAGAEDRPDIEAETYTWANLMDLPSRVGWQVHCDACNPHTDPGTGTACEGCYWFGVERCATWAQLVDWTAHLAEKGWVLEATNWMEFIRAAAHGNAEVGLICHPGDRYRDA